MASADSTAGLCRQTEVALAEQSRISGYVAAKHMPLFMQIGCSSIYVVDGGSAALIMSSTARAAD